MGHRVTSVWALSVGQIVLQKRANDRSSRLYSVLYTVLDRWCTKCCIRQQGKVEHNNRSTNRGWISSPCPANLIQAYLRAQTLCNEWNDYVFNFFFRGQEILSGSVVRFAQAPYIVTGDTQSPRPTSQVRTAVLLCANTRHKTTN